MDLEARCFEKIVEDGQITYYVATDNKVDSIVLKKDEELPLGALRARPFSIDFLKNHMFSKVEIKASDIRKLSDFANNFPNH